MRVALGATNPKFGVDELVKLGNMGATRSLAEFLDFCGVYIEDEETREPLGTGRARMGLLPKPKEHLMDVVIKYGGWPAFERAKERLSS